VTPAGWEHFDVEADVGVRAWGPTREEAFAQAALGVFALIVAPDEVVPRETREVRAQGDSIETLLVNWIDECLYMHEIEGFVAHRIGPLRTDGGLVHGVLHGEPLDVARHRLGTVVKGATFHRLAVVERPGLHEVRIIVDV
jgi:tRNA nucleotidyltransferase (CCA-adding enzyme)